VAAAVGRAGCAVGDRVCGTPVRRPIVDLPPLKELPRPTRAAADAPAAEAVLVQLKPDAAVPATFGRPARGAGG